jgi:hypothetical protein
MVLKIKITHSNHSSQHNHGLRNFVIKHGPKSQGFLENFNRVFIYLFRAIEYPSSLQFSAYDDLEAEKWDITKEKWEKK